MVSLTHVNSLKKKKKREPKGKQSETKNKTDLQKNKRRALSTRLTTVFGFCFVLLFAASASKQKQTHEATCFFFSRLTTFFFFCARCEVAAIMNAHSFFIVLFFVSLFPSFFFFMDRFPALYLPIRIRLIVLLCCRRYLLHHTCQYYCDCAHLLETFFNLNWEKQRILKEHSNQQRQNNCQQHHFLFFLSFSLYICLQFSCFHFFIC